ncbi:MAG: glutamate-5-semialdehyde dehydrogenase [Treponema sp.]|nr:glutamate-5-semialdehyde dehydrogenase [Treponema sp.]
MTLEEMYESLRDGSRKLAVQNATEKNIALQSVINSIEKHRAKIIEANKIDVQKAREKGTSEALIDRLSLDDKKINGILDSVRVIIQQTDPVGEEIAGWKTPNGISIKQVRVPIGVIAIIYESRPNVTVDAFALAYKSGNAILLRGSSSAINSNKAIVQAIKEGLESAENGIPQSIELAPCQNHEEVEQILTAVGKIDLALPRGNQKLIQMVVNTAKVPVIETGSGICHLFVNKDADLQMALNIAENGKIQRPGVCNALECILVHKEIAKEFLPELAKRFNNRVEIRADSSSYEILKNSNIDSAKLVSATQADYGFEFLDLICTVKIVEDVEEAISYINSHNSKHSECIITNDRNTARLFQTMVDASCVYVNASTRFTDGGEFGFGAELGISTQKLHARGPMGIKVLTTTKYLIDGDGQIR